MLSKLTAKFSHLACSGLASSRFVRSPFRNPAFRTMMMTTNGSVVGLLLMATGVWTVLTIAAR